MAQPSGTRLGACEIVSALGAGGMGEVYRARDTKLGRGVALKLLPDSFVNDPERVARFRREAQVLASLNHPNIASIYGLEEGAGLAVNRQRYVVAAGGDRFLINTAEESDSTSMTLLMNWSPRRR